MYKIFFRSILLSCFIFSSVGFSATQNVYSPKSLNAFSHTYIQSALSNVRVMPSKLLTVMPQLDFTYDHIANKSLSLHAMPCFRYLMIEGGLTDWDAVGSTALASMRLNFVLGALYSFPFYFRCGYDYLPFGHHASEAIVPQHIITRSILDEKNILFEIGGAKRSAYQPLQSSLVVFITNPSKNRGKSVKTYAAVCMNFQYASNEVPRKQMRNIVKHYKIGGGIGTGILEPTEQDAPGALPLGVLLNTYGKIDFDKNHHFQWEFIYNTVFHSRFDSNFYNHPLCLHSLHIEWAKQFPELMLAKWPITSMFILGYEWGSRPFKEGFQHINKNPEEVRIQDRLQKHLRKNLFGAFKLGVWKHHITLLLGAQKNFAYQDGLEPFFKVNVAL